MLKSFTIQITNNAPLITNARYDDKFSCIKLLLKIDQVINYCVQTIIRIIASIGRLFKLEKGTYC